MHTAHADDNINDLGAISIIFIEKARIKTNSKKWVIRDVCLMQEIT